MENRNKPRPQPSVKVKRRLRQRVIYVSSTSAKNPTFRPRKTAVTPCTPERRDQRKNSQLKKKYGITIADYHKILGLQNGKCAICSTDTPKGRRAFHVDHCHRTKKVRGLLCSSCNTGLGHFLDNTEILEAAIKYLRAALVDSVEQAKELLK